MQLYENVLNYLTEVNEIKLIGSEDPIEEVDVVVEVDCKLEFEGNEVLVVTEDARHEVLKEGIRNSLFAFRPEFLANVTNLPIEAFQALTEKYEDGNEGILKLVECSCGLDKLVSEATMADGAGHFLNPVDGEEYIVETTTGKTVYVYLKN